MIQDYIPGIITAIQAATGLNVYHESYFNQQSAATPCVSYFELNNEELESAGKIKYSTIRLQIKIWDTNLAVIADTAVKLDKCMYQNGFKRTASTELSFNGLISRIYTYTATALEID